MLWARIKKLFKRNCIFLRNSNPFWPGDNWSLIDLYWYIVRREQCSKVCYAGIYYYLILLSRGFYFWKTSSAISCSSIGLIWCCSPETLRNVPFTCTDTCVHSQKLLCFLFDDWRLNMQFEVKKRTFHIYQNIFRSWIVKENIATMKTMEETLSHVKSAQMSKNVTKFR